MAIALASKTNVTAPNGTYPYGQVRDNPGDNTGTPLNKATLEDYLQFFARMLDKAGVTANGLPDNETNDWQYWEAFEALTGSGAWVDGLTPVGSGGLTIGAGDVIYNRYRIAGKTLYWQINIENATIAGAPVEVSIDLPAAISSLVFANDNGVQVGCYQGTTVLFVKTDLTAAKLELFLEAAAPFTNGTNDQSFSFSLVIPLQ